MGRLIASVMAYLRIRSFCNFGGQHQASTDAHGGCLKNACARPHIPAIITCKGQKGKDLCRLAALMCRRAAWFLDVTGENCNVEARRITHSRP